MNVYFEICTRDRFFFVKNINIGLSEKKSNKNNFIYLIRFNRNIEISFQLKKNLLLTAIFSFQWCRFHANENFP